MTAEVFTVVADGFDTTSVELQANALKRNFFALFQCDECLGALER